MTSTSSWLWETPFSLEKSLGASGNLVGTRATSFVSSFSFSAAPIWSTSLGGTVEDGRALAEILWPDLESLGALSAEELEGPAILRARG